MSVKPLAGEQDAPGSSPWYQGSDEKGSEACLVRAYDLIEDPRRAQ